MDAENAMTAADLERLRAELEDLETNGRHAIAAQIKTAREWGDLKENAEYHAAKDAQAHLETKIKSLREKELTAQVVEVEATDVIGFGSSVELSDEATGRTLSYTLVAQHEAQPAQGRISADSPVGVALRGLRAGDTATVPTPRGERRLRVASVS